MQKGLQAGLLDGFCSTRQLDSEGVNDGGKIRTCAHWHMS